MHRCHIIYYMDPPGNVLQSGLGNTLHCTSQLGWEASFVIKDQGILLAKQHEITWRRVFGTARFPSLVREDGHL